MLLRRAVKAFLLAKAGHNGKAMEVTSNVAGAVTVTCKAAVFSLVNLQAWLKVALALETSPLAGQALVWLPCVGKADFTLAKFTTEQLKVSELGVQHNSTYAMSAGRIIAEQAKAEEEARALAAMANEVALASGVPMETDNDGNVIAPVSPEVAPASPEVAPASPVRVRRARASRQA